MGIPRPKDSQALSSARRAPRRTAARSAPRVAVAAPRSAARLGLGPHPRAAVAAPRTACGRRVARPGAARRPPAEGPVRSADRPWGVRQIIRGESVRSASTGRGAPLRTQRPSACAMWFWQSQDTPPEKPPALPVPASGHREGQEVAVERLGRRAVLVVPHQEVADDLARPRDLPAPIPPTVIGEDEVEVWMRPVRTGSRRR